MATAGMADRSEAAWQAWVLRRRMVAELGVDPRVVTGIITSLMTHGYLRRAGDLASRAEAAHV